ncbi:unnamed protein product [Anisakis simplex]|uniref:Uncharacterized protein n=1 Tax=Anisakis simplex TaxID=6269 RepID=A0A3P6PS56_ANISI|nr:unnamed protein product [Anisakis simplex]
MAKEIIGIGRKKKADTSYIAKEVLPDPNGIRVEPKIDSVKEKYESKKASKPRQPKSEPKKEGADVRKFMKKTNDVNNDKDAPHSRKNGKKKKKFELDSSEELEDDFIETLDDDIQEIIPSKTNDVEIGEKRKVFHTYL